MKKILLAMLAIALTFAGPVSARKEDGPTKARNVKVHQKQAISKSEREALEDAATKGKPTPSPDKPVAFVPLASGILGAPLPSGGERRAIVIGLANYEGMAMDLCEAYAKTEDPIADDNTDLTRFCQDSDSLHLEEALNSVYGYEDITLLRDGTATREAIRKALFDLAERTKAEDEIVFFFSGHGVTGEFPAAEGSTFDTDGIHEGILPYDYLDEEGVVSPIFDDEIALWAAGIEAERMIFAFDACRAGGMDELQGANRILALASGEIQSASTFYLGGTSTGTGIYQESEGLFSHYFAKRSLLENYEGKPDGANLLSKKSPLKYDGNVSVEEAFSYTFPLVSSKQTPVLKDFDRNLDLLLGR